MLTEEEIEDFEHDYPFTSAHYPEGVGNPTSINKEKVYSRVRRPSEFSDC